MKFSGNYFDGISAEPHCVSVNVLKENFQINFEQKKSLIINWSKIEEAKFLEKNSYFFFKEEDNFSQKSLEIFNSKTVFEEYQEYKKDRSGFFHSILYSRLRFYLLLFFIAIPLLFFGYRFILFKSYHLIPFSWDKKVGDMLFQYLIKPEKILDWQEFTEVKKDVKKVLNIDNKKYQIYLIDDNTVNAGALPGGIILINKGLIKDTKSQQELIAIIAHEMVHIDKRHYMQNLVRILGISFIISTIVGNTLEGFEYLETLMELGNLTLFFKFSKNFEREADNEALKILKIHKINPNGMRDFFIRHNSEFEKIYSTIEKHNTEKVKEEKTEKEIFSNIMYWLGKILKWIKKIFLNFSTHPEHEERIQNINKFIELNNYEFNALNTYKHNWKKLKKRVNNLKAY